MKNIIVFLKESFEWCGVFIIMPYLLVKAYIEYRRLKKENPDKLFLYGKECKYTKIEDWDEVYEKYYGEDA